MLALSLSLALGLFADRVRARSTEPGCVAERAVQAALDERFAPSDPSDAGPPAWELAYVVRDRGRDVELAITLRAAGAAALERRVTVASSDCASTPALLAAMVERYFRGIGWTAGAPAPTLAPATKVDDAATGEAKKREGATPVATTTAAPEPGAPTPLAPTSSPPPAADPARAALTLRALAAVTSYPATQWTGAAGVGLRAGWLAPEVVIALPTATTSSLATGGTAHLGSWGAQLWLTAATDAGPIELRGGPIVGAAFESASTASLDRTNQRGRAALDLGLGFRAGTRLAGPVGVGIGAWGARTLAEPDFYLEGPAGAIALGAPWQPGWKGSVALDVEFRFSL